MALLLVGKES